MATIRYAVRVRGRASDVAMAASQEGLEMTVEPVRTVLRGRLPDQAALLGVLARTRLLGLELIEVRRQPQGPSQEMELAGAPDRLPAPGDAELAEDPVGVRLHGVE